MNPKECGGWFILDKEKCRQKGIVEVNADLKVMKLLTSGTVHVRTVETLEITDGFYAQADLSVLAALEENEQLTYTLTGFDEDGLVVDQLEGEGHIAWPALCRETCSSGWWAWSLTAYSDLSQGFIELSSSSFDGMPYYFYSKAGPSWDHFIGQFPNPSLFGIGAPNWTNAFTNLLNNAPNLRVLPANMVPGDARGYNGLPIHPISPGTNVIAVSKGLGPWRTISGLYTENIAAQGLCAGTSDELSFLFNARPEVAQRYATSNLEPLTCPGMLTGGGATGWGGSYDCAVEVITVANDGQGNSINLVDYVTDVFGCEGELQVSYAPGMEKALALSTGIIISRFEEEAITHKLNIPFPSKTDPKLIPVPKTTLVPGLYEFLFVMQDGGMLSRFVEFTMPTTLKAEYASFTNVNIYPVPVNDKVFAIDMDLIVPAEVSIHIVNGQGAPYYTEDLEFELAGRNKHVVNMSARWPNGIYHAIFTYQDGSSTTRSFIVDIE